MNWRTLHILAAILSMKMAEESVGAWHWLNMLAMALNAYSAAVAE